MKPTCNPLDFRHFEPEEYAEQKVFEDINKRFNRARQAYDLREDQWPTVHETPSDYRVRLMRGLQPHTEVPRNNLLALRDDPQALDAMEKRIIRDAIADVGQQGKLVEIQLKTPHGQPYSEFEGALGSWFSQYKLKPLKMTKLNGKEVPIIPLG